MMLITKEEREMPPITEIVNNPEIKAIHRYITSIKQLLMELKL